MTKNGICIQGTPEQIPLNDILFLLPQRLRTRLYNGQMPITCQEGGRFLGRGEGATGLGAEAGAEAGAGQGQDRGRDRGRTGQGQEQDRGRDRGDLLFSTIWS